MYSLVKAVKAISDDTRIRILNILLVKECCVCEVMQALQISPTRASRNLNTLYDAGFLRMRKEGLWTLYSLNKSMMPEYLSKLVEAIELALENNNIAQNDRERVKKAIRRGPGCTQQEMNTCSGNTISRIH